MKRGGSQEPAGGDGKKRQPRAAARWGQRGWALQPPHAGLGADREEQPASTGMGAGRPPGAGQLPGMGAAELGARQSRSGMAVRSPPPVQRTAAQPSGTVSSHAGARTPGTGAAGLGARQPCAGMCAGPPAPGSAAAGARPPRRVRQRRRHRPSTMSGGARRAPAAPAGQ